MFVTLCVATGVACGFWTASVTYPCRAFCSDAQPRFVMWQSCLVGGAAAAIVLILAGTLDRDFARGGVQGMRSIMRYLSEDLSRRQIR